MTPTRMKNISLIIVCFIVFSVSTTTAREEFQTHLLKRFFSIGTASINGAYFPLGTAMSRLFNSHMDEIVTISEPTSGSVANIEFLRNGDLALALIQSDVAYHAYHGDHGFTGNPFPKLRILASLYSEIVHIAVRAESKIQTIKDLKGKIIAIGEKGSGTAVNAEMILEAFDLTDRDYQPSYLSFTKATSALLAGDIAAVFFTGGLPSEGLSLLGEKTPIRMLSFPEDMRKKIVSSYAFLSPVTIPKGIYPGQSQEIPSVGLRALFATRDDFDPILAERMLNLLFDNIHYLSSESRTAKEINLAHALEGVENTMLHDGARKYYTSRGIHIKALVNK